MAVAQVPVQKLKEGGDTTDDDPRGLHNDRQSESGQLTNARSRFSGSKTAAFQPKGG